MIAYMLACKRRFFNKESLYDDFSHFMATNVFIRMSTPRQFLPEDDPKYLSPIKSCLNYMKQIIYVRKCEFLHNEFSNAIDYNKCDDDFSKVTVSNKFRNNMTDLVNINVNSYLNKIESIIYKEVSNGVYGNDEVLV